MSIVSKIQRPAILIFTATLLLLMVAAQAFSQTESQPAVQQDDNTYAYSHDLKDQTITFEAVNPKTDVAGLVTVTISGAFKGNRWWEGYYAGGVRVTGEQRATFSFVPTDPFQPTYNGKVSTLRFGGDSKNDSIWFDSVIKGVAQDGSTQRFKFREIVKVSESGAEITFAQQKLSDEENSAPDLPCESASDQPIAPTNP